MATGAAASGPAATATGAAAVPVSVVELFRQQVRQRPNETALIFPDRRAARARLRMWLLVGAAAALLTIAAAVHLVQYRHHILVLLAVQVCVHAVRLRAPSDTGTFKSRSVTYAELHRLQGQFLAGFARHRMRAGQYILVLWLPPDEAHLIALGLAALQAGLVMVRLDPFMCGGWRSFFRLLPLVGSDVTLIPQRWAPLVKCIAWIAKLPIGRLVVAEGLLMARPESNTLPSVSPTLDLPFGILPTTGSTGPAKAVVLTHGMLSAAVQIYHELVTQARSHAKQDGRIATLHLLPLYTLFDVCLGNLAVLGPFHPRKMAAADPAKLYQIVEDYQIHVITGSSVVWWNLLQFAARTGRRMHSPVLGMGGGAAIIPSHCQAILHHVLPSVAEFNILYGSTEAMPITVARSSHAPAATFRGMYVGAPLGQISIRITQVRAAVDDTLTTSTTLCAHGFIGQVLVAGPCLSAGYALPGHSVDRSSMQHVGDESTMYHATGDLGWIDGSGGLWLIGRMSHSFVTSFGDQRWVSCCELVENAVDAVIPSDMRSLFVRHPPAVCIAPRVNGVPRPITLSETQRAAIRAAVASVPCWLITSNGCLDPEPRPRLSAAVEIQVQQTMFKTDGRHQSKLKR